MLVRQNLSTTFTSSSATVTLPSVDAGDTLIVVILASVSASAGNTTFTLSDGINGSWSQFSPGNWDPVSASIWSLRLAYFLTSAASAGTVTFTANFTAAMDTIRFLVLEYSGLTGIDGGIPSELNNGAGATTTITAPSKTTGNAADVVISYLGTVSLQGSQPGIDSGFAVEEYELRLSVADITASSIGTFAPTWSIASSFALAGLAAFKGTAVPQPPSGQIFVPDCQAIVFGRIFSPVLG